MHCTHSSRSKGTSQAKATPNSEKIKLVALAVHRLLEYFPFINRKISLYSQKKKKQEMNLYDWTDLCAILEDPTY